MSPALLQVPAEVLTTYYLLLLQVPAEVLPLTTHYLTTYSCRSQQRSERITISSGGSLTSMRSLRSLEELQLYMPFSVAANEYMVGPVTMYASKHNAGAYEAVKQLTSTFKEGSH